MLMPCRRAPAHAPPQVGFLAVSGNYAYTIAWVARSFTVLDVSTPTAPSIVGFITTSTKHGVCARSHLTRAWPLPTRLTWTSHAAQGNGRSMRVDFRTIPCCPCRAAESSAADARCLVVVGMLAVHAGRCGWQLRVHRLLFVLRCGRGGHVRPHRSHHCHHLRTFLPTETCTLASSSRTCGRSTPDCIADHHASAHACRRVPSLCSATMHSSPYLTKTN